MTNTKRPRLQIHSPGTTTGAESTAQDALKPPRKMIPAVLRGAVAVVPMDERERERSSTEWAPNPAGIEELSKGKLPKAQEEVLAHSGYRDYVLGTNQRGIQSVEQCKEYLRKWGGLELPGNDGILQQFLTFNSGYLGTTDERFIREHVVNGFYGRDDQKVKRGGFRMLGVFPITEGLKQQWGDGLGVAQGLDVFRVTGGMPEDLLLYGDIPSMGIKAEVVNQKYIAGLIDDSGNYFMNPDFMQEPALPTQIDVGQ